MLRRLTIVVVALSLAGCIASPDPETSDGEVPATDVGNGILEGSIVDNSFVPIPGATVSLVGTERVVHTSPNGHFRFTNLEPGVYRLTVDAVGWAAATIEGRVKADFATRLTVFLDPLLELGGYSTIEHLRGELNCADVEVPGAQSVSCEPEYHRTSFPTDWAAVLIEVDWGSGFSSSALAELTAEDTEADLLYADLVSERPARIVLRPETLHDGLGGKDRTPIAGETAALDLGIKKAPAEPVPEAGVAMTVDEAYEMFITTFYHQVPADLDAYTALPGP